MIKSQTQIAACVFALTATAFASPALAEGVLAGTLIENTAQASYETPGGTETIDSNTVTLRVDELIDVATASLESGPVLSTDGTAVLAYSVTNTGNGPEAYTLTANPSVAGNDFDPTVEGIAIDTNGNGVYDPGVDELLTSPEQTAVLDPDASVTVFIILSVDPSVLDGQEAQVDLLAEAVTGTGAPGTVFAGEGTDGVDAVAGPNGADDNALGSIIVGVATLELLKEASVLDPFGGNTVVPGSVITYTLNANVTGTGTVDALVITDIIPDDTTYEITTLTLDGSALSDAADADEGEASDASGISVALGDVAGGASHSITFDVRVD